MLRGVVAAPYLIDGNEIHISASIGISPYEANISRPEVMMIQADLALYRAKQDGVSLAREFKRGFGQRHPVRLNASLADGSLLRLGLRRHDPQHLERLRDYFGADTIAGHDCNLHR